MGVVEEDLPRLAELVSFDVELVVEGLVEGYVEDGSEAPGAPSSVRAQDNNNLLVI